MEGSLEGFNRPNGIRNFVGDSLFQSCMVLGKNDILYTLTFVYWTISLCDPRVLLLLDRMMDSDLTK